jgi:predicted MFS family arabinose efflux permease
VQIGVAFMLALLLGPIIAVKFDINGVFWVIALLSLMAIFMVILLPKVPPKKQYKLSLSNIKGVLNAKLLGLNFNIFALHFLLTLTFIALPSVLASSQMLSIDKQWLLYLPVIVLSFMGMIPVIILAEKYQKFKLVFLIAITLLLLTQFILSQFPLTYWRAFSLLTIFFVAFNALEAILPARIAKHAPNEKRGLAMGFYASSQFLGAFMGGVFGGLIHHIFGLNSVFLLGTFLASIWWVFTFTFKHGE